MMEEHEHDSHEVVAFEGHADEGWTDIITDPAHLMAEGLSEGLFLILGILVNRWLLHRRDKAHNH